MKIIKAVRFDQQGEVYTLEQGTHDWVKIFAAGRLTRNELNRAIEKKYILKIHLLTCWGTEKIFTIDTKWIFI